MLSSHRCRRNDFPIARRSRVAGAVATLVVVFAAALVPNLPAQQRTATNPSSPTIPELALEQGRIADTYQRLEQLMIRMAELEEASNPQRAALLKRAAQQSADRLTRSQMNTLVGLLTPPAQLR